MSARLLGERLEWLTARTLFMKVHPMRQFDRRVSVAPMMDWTDEVNELF